MASSLSSRINFFDETGAKIACPVEGRKCDVVIDVPPEFHPYISLQLGTVPLEVHSEAGAPFAYASWTASGPGNYDLTLICGDIREHRTITVIPEYFGESDYNSIISELTDFLPKSIVSKLRECGAYLGTDETREQKPTIQDDLFRLQHAIRGTNEKFGLLQILPIIQRECNQILVPRLEIRPINKMRRPDISRLPQAMSMPGNMITIDELYQMFDVTVEQSFETSENQLVKTYVQALRSQLSRLQDRMKAESAPLAMANELDILASEFHLALHARLLFEKGETFNGLGTTRYHGAFKESGIPRST